MGVVTYAPKMRGRTSEAWLDLRRLALLAAKCLRFGLFPLANWVPFAGYRRWSFAARFRRALEDLGLTYLKLGQFLALRFDILPPEVCEELNRLFETVPPMPAEAARSLIEAELGGRLETFFVEFAAEPIAAASVAQVHRAVLRGGQVVAVKIQRRGLEAVFKADIRNLTRAARLVDALGWFGRLSAASMVREFAEWTLRELDFRLEAETSEQIARRSEAFVVIPRVIWERSSPRVLTMEFVEGVSASQLSQLLEKGGPGLVRSRLPGLDLELSLRRFTEASLSQLFVEGFFHGDPHPGNIMFRNDNRVAFLDFGIFGSLSPAERESVAGQIERLALGDIAGSFQFYSRQLVPTEDTDCEQFQAEAMEVLRRWHESVTNLRTSIRERHLAKYTTEMIEVSRRHHLRYGMNYLLFWRALNHLNATLWLLAPDYDLMAQLRTFFERIRPGWLDRARAILLDTRTKGAWAEALPAAVSAGEECVSGREGAQAGAFGVSIVESDRRPRRRAGRVSGVTLAVLALPVAVVAATASVPLPARASLGLLLVGGWLVARSSAKAARPRRIR